MSKTIVTARQVLEHIQGLEEKGADLDKPLQVYIPHDDTGDFIENGAYELYQPYAVQVDVRNEPCLVVEAVGGA